MSNFNLLTYLIDHRDGRDGNILVSEDDEHRRVFAVDNGISFGPLVYNFFVPNWTKLRVAAVRKESIDRLREIRREDLDFLAVVAQLEVDEEGVLRSVPPGAPFDADDGAVARDGSVQFGLTTSEIDDVYARIEALIRGGRRAGASRSSESRAAPAARRQAVRNARARFIYAQRATRRW